MDVDVQTPLGNYKALEATTEGADGKAQDYYALNTGLIKTVFSSKGIDITSSLSKIESNSSLEQNIAFYYPSGPDYKAYYKHIPMTFHTNDITKSALEKYLKTVPSKNLGRLLGPNAKINSPFILF
jgi:hypothetical protein